MDYSNFLIFIKDFSFYSYLTIGILSFFESFAFIGLLVPGSVALITGGVLASHGAIDLSYLFVFSSAGAIFGDSFSFYLGKKGIIKFHEKNKIFKISLLKKGEQYFKKHGGKSVFWGRFIGCVRPITPFVAGVFNLNKRTFLFWNILSGILWSASHIFIGYFFGQVLWYNVFLSVRMIILVVVIVGFIAIIYKYGLTSEVLDKSSSDFN